MTSDLRIVRLIARWLIRVVLFGLLGLVVAALTVLIVIPRATHGVALTVLTGSMAPDIPVGSTVIDRPVDTGTLHVGDIATYQKAPGVDEYITHRIVKIDTSTTPTTFTFKGDANRGPDITPVPATAIRGKVWFHVPYLGGIHDAIRGGFGRALLLGAAIVCLAGFAVKQLAHVSRVRSAKDGDTGGEPARLDMEFDLRAFGEVDPTFVADLLHGELEVRDGMFGLHFTGTPERLAVLRDMLAPYGHETTRTVAAAPSETETLAANGARGRAHA
jgi:signal peptidase I